MGKVIAALAAVALTGGIWLATGAVGAPGWLQVAATAVVGAGLALIAALETAWRLWGEDEVRAPDPAALEAFEQMSLHAVRTRADEFQQDAEVAPRKARYAYEIPANAWRQLEKTLRHEGALEVGDLGRDAVLVWAHRLDVLGESAQPMAPLPPLEEPKPKVAAAELADGREWLAKLRVRGQPARRGRRRRRRPGPGS